MNPSPSVNLTNANNQSWAIVFGDATTDNTLAGRIDVNKSLSMTLTSKFLFGLSDQDVGVICAVIATSGALVAEHNALYLNFIVLDTNFCADISRIK